MGISNTLFGIILATIGSVGAATGLIIQKISHNEDLEAAEEDKTCFMCRWRWWVGLLLLALFPAVLEGWSLMLAPLSVIAPLSGTTVVLNTILAVYFLKEKTNWIEGIATVLIIGGIVLTSVFGSHESRDYTTDELLDLFKESAMIGYYALIAGIIAVSLYGCFFLSASPGLNAFAFANLSGLLGGQQNMFLKCFTELLKRTIDGENQFDKPGLYPIVLAVPALAAGQIVFLNIGLAKHDAVAYIPMYQATLSIYGACAGGFYFREFYGFTAVQGSMFGLGLLIVCVGLLLMGQGDHSAQAPESEKDGDQHDCGKNSNTEEGPDVDKGDSPYWGGVHPEVAWVARPSDRAECVAHSHGRRFGKRRERERRKRPQLTLGSTDSKQEQMPVAGTEPSTVDERVVLDQVGTRQQEPDLKEAELTASHIETPEGDNMNRGVVLHEHLSGAEQIYVVAI